MDTPAFDVRRLTAGEEYLGALRRLGLDPDALLWAYDQVAGEYVLVLVTAMVDFKGPFAISQLLFDAYNASATPQEIDPFVVRLHSPEQAIVPELLNFAAGGTAHKLDRITMKPEFPFTFTGGTLDGLTVNRDWVIKIRPRSKKPDLVTLSRRWRRFQRNVEQVAAA